MGDVVIRAARREDVPAVVALLVDDPLGATRDDAGDLRPYLSAFVEIDAADHELLLVADRGVVVGTLQLSFLRGLSRGGALRGQIEAVRVGSGERGRGLGEELVRRAVEQARQRGCVLVQLTSDRSRADAHRFYSRLGFTASHEGFTLLL